MVFQSVSYIYVSLSNLLKPITRRRYFISILCSFFFSLLEPNFFFILIVISFLPIKVPFMLWYIRAVLSILAFIPIYWSLSLFKFTPRYLKFVTCLRILPFIMILMWDTCFPNVITFYFSALIISFFFTRALLHFSMFFCRFCSLLAKFAKSWAKKNTVVYIPIANDVVPHKTYSFRFWSVITSSIIKLNSNGFSTLPCLTPSSATNFRGRHSI